MRRVLGLILVLLVPTLLAPTASAGWFHLEIDVAPHHVGDLLQGRTAWSYVDGEGEARVGNETWVAQVEAIGEAPDKYGIPRPSVAVRADHYADGEATLSERYHLLLGGAEIVRREILAGSNGFGGTWDARVRGGVLESRSATVEMQPVAVFWGACPLKAPMQTRFAEGERVPVRAVFSDHDVEDVPEPGLSLPAEAMEFHGRDALRIRWDLAQLNPDDKIEGFVEVVVADGLPGIVRLVNDGRDSDGGAFRYEHEIEGYTPGTGAVVPADTGARLPERNPAATFAPYQALGLDDAAWRLPYPFEEAFDNLRQDESVGLDEFLENNPGAVLVGAYYSRTDRNEMQVVSGVSAESTDGGWSIAIGNGREVRQWYTSRGDRVGALPLPGQAATKHVDNFAIGVVDWWPSAGAGERPAEAATSASLAKLAAAEGVRPEAVQVLWYGVYPQGDGAFRGFFAVSDMSNEAGATAGTEEGRNVNMGAQDAALTNVYSGTKRTESEGLLATGDADDLRGDDKLSALGALAGPGVGAGLAGGAATSIAVLVILAKFVLVPLFTRLRRDRLLDNPVRARLYERLRAEPGIHRAELIDYLGVGEGATRHHLRQLVAHRLVVEMSEGGFVRYYAAGEVPPEVARREAVLRGTSARAVYDLYAAHPDLSLREAGARLGMSAPGVHRVKKRLVEAGLLPVARVVRIEPAPAEA